LHDILQQASGAQVPDQRSSEEIERTRESHQSRRTWDLHNLSGLLRQLGNSSGLDHQRQANARGYRPRLESAWAHLRIFLAQQQTHEGQDALGRFRTAARAIADDVEDQHILDSPDSQLLTADYNDINEALRTMYREIPSEPGFGR